MKKPVTSLLLAISIFGFLLATRARAGELVCPAGRLDAYDTSDGSEPASPSAALVATVSALPTPTSLREFDVCVRNHDFAHTFSACAIDTGLSSAVLVLWLKGDPTGEAYSDRLMLGSGGTLRWGMLMNTLESLRTGGSDGTWSAGDSATFVLDLGNLPPSEASPSGFPSWPAGRTDILAFLRSGGDLDIVLRDDTCVDAMTLQVNSSTPALPASWGSVKVRYR
jgi:hypothetical protein